MYATLRIDVEGLARAAGFGIMRIFLTVANPIKAFSLGQKTFNGVPVTVTRHLFCLLHLLHCF
jgi:hypothetical protein